MKLIIAGSRHFDNYDSLKTAIIDTDLWRVHRKELEIVSGCAKGADRLGEVFAENNNLVCHRFPADWDGLGKKAGHVRNAQMGDFADCLLALWDGISPGTKNMIKYMSKLGKPVYVYYTI